MQRKDLKVGDIVAVFEYQTTDLPQCTPVRITRIGERTSSSRGFGRSHAVTFSGIDGTVLSKSLDETPEVGAIYSYGHKPGEARQDIKANRIYSTWADYAAQIEDAKRAEERSMIELAEITRNQQAEIDHMLSLVPASAWIGQRDRAGRPLRFEPGMTPNLTVANLTALLKAARTAALEEAGDE